MGGAFDVVDDACSPFDNQSDVRFVDPMRRTVSLIGVVGLFESIHIGWVLVKSLFPGSDHPAAIVRCSFVQVIS